MNMDLVSVIVPVYNVESYIDICIQSILKQTYENFELILVDDGSTDKSGVICDNYSSIKNVKVIHKVNGGLSDARNTGIGYANGKYICFIDSDDYVNKEFIATLYDMILVYGVKIAASNLAYVNSEGLCIPANTESNDIEVMVGDEALKYLFSNDKYSNYAWNKMYDVSLFSDLRFPIGRKMEDLGTTYALIKNAGRIAYSSRVLYYYLQREGSILHTPTKDFYIDKFELSYRRYIDIKKWYPDLRENYIFFVNVALDSYNHLNNENMQISINELDKIWDLNRSYFTPKKKLSI